MKNRASQFVAALMTGGSLGTFLAFLLSAKLGTWSAVVGILAGSLICYLSYRPRETAAAFMHALRFVAPHAWYIIRSTPSWIRRICLARIPGGIGNMVMCGVAAGFPFSVLFACSDSVFVGLHWSQIITYMIFCGAITALPFMCLTLFCAVLIALSHRPSNVPKNVYQKMSEEWLDGLDEPWSWSYQINALKVSFFGPFVLAYSALRGSLEIVSFILKAFVLVSFTTVDVLCRTFVMIHSSARVIVSVDGGVGVLLTYGMARAMYGSMFLSLPLATQCIWSVAGGIAAVTIGLANAYIVAPVFGYRPFFQKS